MIFIEVIPVFTLEKIIKKLQFKVLITLANDSVTGTNTQSNDFNSNGLNPVSIGNKGVGMEQSSATKSNLTVEVFIKWLMFTAAISGMGLAASFWPIQGNIPLIVIPSILVLILGKPVFFEKLKLSTLVIIRVLIVVVALGFFPPQLYVNIALWMLVVNILEAAFTDLLRHKQIFNAISGFAVAIGVFALSGLWISDGTVGMYYLATGATVTITILYILVYTLWNWIFVSYEFSPSVALMHVGFLLAPIIGVLTTSWLGALGGVGMWLILRANTLSIGGWMQIANKSWFEREYRLDSFAKFVDWTHKKSVQIVFMIVNVSIVVTLMVLAAQHSAIALPGITS